MTLTDQLRTITDSLEELKGEDIMTLNTTAQSADIEAIVIATARSVQHARGLANNLKIQAKRLGMTVVGIEGTETGQWVLIDLAEVVVHVMTQPTREFYQLEKLWSPRINASDAD